MIELDGAHIEGGGALTRVALALSTYTGKEFKITNIRAGRPTPGLKAQHLTAIKALKEMCNAETSDIKLGSTELTFKPGQVKRGVYNIDIGTAGSITLLLQALILPCLFADGKVTLKVKGGTCGRWQASVDYLQNILLPLLQRFAKMELKILKRGYYPKGGGEIELAITPHDEQPLPIILTERGEVVQVKGVINLSHELQEKEVGERIVQAVKSGLEMSPINVSIQYADAHSIGGELLLWTVSENGARLGGSSLLEKNKTSKDVAKEAVTALKKELDSDAAVDHYLADQLIPFMGLLPDSEIRGSQISDHCKSNIYVVEKFLPVKFMMGNNIIKSLSVTD